MRHETVYLSDLGFDVDVGLEDLIRACWQRGISTDVSCIGGDADYRNGDAWIGFFGGQAAQRWEEITGVTCEWNDDEEVATVAEAYFPRAAIPRLLVALSAVGAADEIDGTDWEHLRERCEAAAEIVISALNSFSTSGAPSVVVDGARAWALTEIRRLVDNDAFAEISAHLLLASDDDPATDEDA